MRRLRLAGRLAAAALALPATALILPAPARAAAAGVALHGGSVLHAESDHLIFWDPPGERRHITAASRAVLTDYLTDVARDSGQPSNLFAVLRQYSDVAGFADYRQSFGPRDAITDRRAFPRSVRGSCAVRQGAFPRCVSDSQVQSELSFLIARRHLPTGWEVTDRAGSFVTVGQPAPVYLLVLPQDVNVCYSDAGLKCASADFCSYHSAFFTGRSGRRIVLYIVLSFMQWQLYPLKGCQGDGLPEYETPAGVHHGDHAYTVVSGVAHELAETITDPLGDGWSGSPAYPSEVADLCTYTGPLDQPSLFQSPQAWAPALGGKPAVSAEAGTLFNQLIDGDEYYTQNVWSNGERGCRGRPEPPAPASFVATIAPVWGQARRPLTLGAFALSARAISSATWSFGDGSPTAFRRVVPLAPVHHAYRHAGSYRVTLTLIDADGNELLSAAVVTVRPRPR